MKKTFVLALAAIAFAVPIDASADTSDAGSDLNGFWAAASTTLPGPGAAPTPRTTNTADAPQVRYVLRNPCGLSINDGAPICPQNTCPADQQIFQLVAVTTDGETPRGLTCVGDNTPITIEAPPQVTDAMVLEAFRRVPVPSLTSMTQPGEKTLVNFDTIFHVDAEGFSRTVSLLGRQVRLDIEPESFRWEFGDGTSTTTSTPGAPYPAKDVVHRYPKAHTTVRHRVVVTWGATWSLDGGPARPVPGTVTTTGPLTPLQVAEAVPALSGRR